MTEYQPGTVAEITTINDNKRRAVRRCGVWMYLDQEGYAIDAYVTDVRPLVVLDIEGPYYTGATEHVIELLRGNWSLLADQIAQQTKPPKPEEPTGLGAVVEDAKGRRWLRDHFGDDEWFWAEPQPGGASGCASPTPTSTP